MTYKKQFSIGIDPSGNGTTGLYLSSFYTKWRYYAYKQITANNPVEACRLIIDEINNFKDKHNLKIGCVVIELLHCGPEKFNEIKATRELIGMLRFVYFNHFCGHLPSDKSKELIASELINKSKKNIHSIHAKAILEAHFNASKLGLKCENWKWEVKKHEKTVE